MKYLPSNDSNLIRINIALVEPTRLRRNIDFSTISHILRLHTHKLRPKPIKKDKHTTV